MPGIGIEWGPTVDDQRCTGCRTCIDFCHQDVYGWDEGTAKVTVVHKLDCVPGCSHCSTLCEAGAISFPTADEIKRLRAATRGDGPTR